MAPTRKRAGCLLIGEIALNLNEINFSFGGLHCLRDFGCIYVENKGHTIAPKIRRNEYDISGTPGTILMPGDLPETLEFDGTLFFVRDPPSQAAAQQQLRRIAAWLTNGRQRLIFDYEPLRYYMASVDDELNWGFSDWIDGGLDVTFTAQPYAYALDETTASATTSGTSAQVNFVLATGAPAPIRAEVLNTGTAPIAGVTLTAGGNAVQLSGMNIASGDALLIDMEPPIGAAFSDGENALPYAARFDYLTARHGPQSISATLAYGSGTKGAKITIKARGRF